ncbi:MAG: DUF4914 family protein [Bacteroidota bacterium]
MSTHPPSFFAVDDLAFSLPAEVKDLLDRAPGYEWFDHPEEILALACGTKGDSVFEVAFELPDGTRYVEATVMRVKNGLAANYPEPYMRRRDPNCMVIGDEFPTEKTHWRDRFGGEFGPIREATFEWLASQHLAVFAFESGRAGLGGGSLVVAPANCGFFAYGLALLQGIEPREKLGPDFRINSLIYVAPPFRHTHFEGKQVVVHNRSENRHELFSYNLYPGPSAKKGIYGVLIGQGEKEGWITAHCSTAEVISPYDRMTVFMHEGASGGGKSEMLQYMHREPDGRIRLGKNLETEVERMLRLPQGCRIRPVTDDMALCHPDLEGAPNKLKLIDAEEAWFVRVNHINHYGIDPLLESLTIHSTDPLLFLNIDASEGSTALIWEHIEDAPGKPCPNPRVILPRKTVPDVVEGGVAVDVRSFGVRTPPCTREHPTYGIVGLFHLLPPALAWLWRLTAPRGHGNPSIVDTGGMTSEGVGSYWPFATGKRSTQANLLLEQFEQYPDLCYPLTPNQHIGIWEVGFMPQWLMREYLTRRGSTSFHADQVSPARCSILGYEMEQVVIEGEKIPIRYLKVYKQKEVGLEGYDSGASILEGFFEKQLGLYKPEELSTLGQRIIQCFKDGGSVGEYESLIPSQFIQGGR